MVRPYAAYLFHERRRNGEDRPTSQLGRIEHIVVLMLGNRSFDNLDNRGLPLIASVHYDKKYNNAFWNGQQMVFGDGDGVIFNDFTLPLDVIGHELTHGVTGSEANLVYQGQSGALNESISDVFGSMVKQYKNNESVDKADWLIGKGLFTSKVHGTALRSMAAPGTAYDDPILGKDPQPPDMQHYVNTPSDNAARYARRIHDRTSSSVRGAVFKPLPAMPSSAHQLCAMHPERLSAVGYYYRNASRHAEGSGWRSRRS